LLEITRVAVVLKPKQGEPIAYVAESRDGSRRRYAVELPSDKIAPGWVPAGIYAVQVLVWIAGESAPHKWVPMVGDKKAGEREMVVEITEESRRPLTREREAA
jgi:hypothetical protein